MSQSIMDLTDELGLRLQLHRVLSDPNSTLADAATIEYKIARLRSPYGEWCRNPKACAGKGSCPLDPTCGD